MVCALLEHVFDPRVLGHFRVRGHRRRTIYYADFGSGVLGQSSASLRCSTTIFSPLVVSLRIFSGAVTLNTLS